MKKTYQLLIEDHNDYLDVIYTFQRLKIPVSKLFFERHYKYVLVFIDDTGDVTLGGNYSTPFIAGDRTTNMVSDSSFDEVLPLLLMNIRGTRCKGIF